MVSENFARFKDAVWFQKLKDSQILVVGCGGIASWLSLLLARTGANLYIYDGDRIESHNNSGQLFETESRGNYKVEAIQKIIEKFCGFEMDIEVFPEMYTEYTNSNPIVVTGLDSMKARRIVYESWIKFLEKSPKEIDNAILIDGRMNFESYTIFCIKGNDKKAQEIYEKEHLFEDSEVEEQQCSMKATSHIGAMIAGHMTGLLCNFFGEEFRDAPLYTRFDLPINMMSNE